MTGEQNQLLCSGIPGAGKTVLASIVINNLLTQFDNDVAVTWVYCSYKEKGSQTFLVAYFYSFFNSESPEQQDT